MNQQVMFDTDPTINPDEAVDHGRFVVNATTGSGMDVLKEVVQEYIPTADHDETVTNKDIIRTDRYECPCCPTYIEALVRVNCVGLQTKQCNEISGLYKVGIYPEIGAYCEVIVEKLSGSVICKNHRKGHLPKKIGGKESESWTDMSNKGGIPLTRGRRKPTWQQKMRWFISYINQ